MKLRNVISILNQIAPPQYACVWDKQIGLQIGDKNQEIKKIFLTLDVTAETVEKAIKANADLLVAHHALFFNPLEKIDLAKPAGQIISKLIKKDIALFVAHTNLDSAPDGVNWTLARAEGLDPEKCEVLEPTFTEKLYKFVVYVPEEAVDKVHAAIVEANAGHIGNYSDCTFRTKGEGTFKPLAGTKPYIGKTGKLEKVSETKIETIIPEDKLGELISKVKAAHPYEEVAYDVYPLQNKGRVLGIGLLDVKKKLAVSCGSGGSLVQKAYDKGARKFIIGEAGYHDQLLAESLGLELVIKGHYETEVLVLPVLKQKLQSLLKDNSIEIKL